MCLAPYWELIMICCVQTPRRARTIEKNRLRGECTAFNTENKLHYFTDICMHIHRLHTITHRAPDLQGIKQLAIQHSVFLLHEYCCPFFLNICLSDLICFLWMQRFPRTNFYMLSNSLPSINKFDYHWCCSHIGLAQVLI